MLNDEPYRWAARTDVTPGFTTAGLSFLLTGLGPDDALAELEAQRLPEKTLRAGRLLLAELERRSPKHPALPGLHVKVMERLVQRGKGDEALGLLAKAEGGNAGDARRGAPRGAPGDAADEGAAREGDGPLDRAARAPRPGRQRSGLGRSRRRRGRRRTGKGSKRRTAKGPERRAGSRAARPRTSTTGSWTRRSSASTTATARTAPSLALLLGEMDRLPRAEAVWLKSVDRISSWKLDDDLEPRYRKAIAAFEGPEWWKKLARWYARRQRTADLKALGEEIAASFRGSALFSRDPMLQEAVVPLEQQPNPYVLFSDFLALRALQRFPSSPAVLERAESRLLARSSFDALKAKRPQDVKDRAVVDDALLALRRDAVLWADAPRRGRFLDALVQKGALETFLRRLEEIAREDPRRERPPPRRMGAPVALREGGAVRRGPLGGLPGRPGAGLGGDLARALALGVLARARDRGRANRRRAPPRQPPTPRRSGRRSARCGRTSNAPPRRERRSARSSPPRPGTPRRSWRRRPPSGTTAASARLSPSFRKAGHASASPPSTPSRRES